MRRDGVMLEEQKIISPDAIYGTAPFWAWNGRMTREGIKRTVAEIKKAGFGGAFVHPRPGLTNVYLSEDWFELWKAALNEAKKAGIKLYIYDENTYPTGYAGGHIISRLPDCAARSVKVRIFESPEEFLRFRDDKTRPEEERSLIRLYRAERFEGKLAIQEDMTGKAEEPVWKKETVFVGISMQQSYASVWFGGFPNTDILRPEVTKELLECTYEEYSRRFKEDFGRVIPAVFSDEPGISPGSVWLEDPMAFPFSRYFAAEFYRRRGYTLEDNMVCIPLDVEESLQGRPATKVRFDYYCTLRELWAENFAVPLQEWCDTHGIAWTGHFLDEHWPYPWGGCSPAVMSMYEYMHWPGIDMLMSHMLKEDGKSPMLLSVKELSSVGSQLGKKRLLCECYGAGGWDAAVTDFKRIGDWLAVHGITFFNQHLWLHSLTGIRKYGHPQSFDPREPWWEEYGRLTSYYTRLSFLLSQGHVNHKVLLLNPSTSWFVRRPEEQKGDILWGYQGLAADDPVKTYIELLQRLDQNLIGFDLGDEFILEKYGRIEGKQAIVGEAVYDCIVIPGEMSHMLSSTVRLIGEALDAGVKVFRLGDMPGLIDGMPYPKPDWNAVYIDADALAGELRRQNYQILPIEGEGIGCLLRDLGSGEKICFFSNSTPKEQCCLAELPAGEVWRIDLFNGKKYRYFPEFVGQRAEIRLHTCETLVLYWTGAAKERCSPGAGDPDCREAGCLLPQKDPGKPVGEKNGSMVEKRELKPAYIRRKEDNVLVLDYGDLILRGEEYRDIYVTAASEKVFHAHGMERNPWDMAVQFQNRYIGRNQFGEDTGFTMRFWFEAAEIPERLLLAVERPGLYRIRVNGHLLSWNEKEFWLDEEFGMLDIHAYAVCGRNEILIEGAPFDLMMEIQPIYILGDFCVDIEKGKFMIRRARPLETGGLKDQGIRFYGGRVQYVYQLELEKPDPGEWHGIMVGTFEGTALSLYVNGQYAGQAGIGMGEVMDITSWVKAGRNEIKVEVSCSLKNVFGPFHTQDRIRNSAWPAAWKQAPSFGMPKPDHYDTIDYGLQRNPVYLRGRIRTECSEIRTRTIPREIRKSR